MEQNRELMYLLSRIERANRIQTIICSILCAFALIASICFVMLFAKVYAMLPQLNTVITQMEAILTDLEEVVEKMNTVDFKALNQAIGDLADVIEPLANFFKLFK